MERLNGVGGEEVQMLGLWYIMGIATLVAIVCIGASHITWATGTNRIVTERTRSFAAKSMKSISVAKQ